MKLQPVILAGGSGYRLWPLSQTVKPKQFVKYYGNLSPFQRTVMRNSRLGAPLVIANIMHESIVISQLQEVCSSYYIIFEFEPKNTASAALSACYYAQNLGCTNIVLIPSDHHVKNEIDYNTTLVAAIRASIKNKFSLIGIKPSSPNVNFGYVKTDDVIGQNLYSVSEFIEKPNAALALRLFNVKKYFWNSGIYFFDIEYILEKANEFIPEMSLALSEVFNSDFCKKQIIELDMFAYQNIPFVSFDEVFSCNIKEFCLINGEFGWVDLGSFEAIYNLEEKDENQNSINGNVMTKNVRNSYINSDAKQTLVIGLSDVVVVLKNEQLLVSNKNSTGMIKEMVAKFDKKKTNKKNKRNSSSKS